MKYVKLDGSIGECEPASPSFEDLKEIVDGEINYHLPRIDAHSSLDELVSHVMGIISMKPFYLSVTDIPWMLAYMEGLRDFAIQRDEEPGLRFGYNMNTIEAYALSGTREAYSKREIPKPNFIDLSRRFTCIELIVNHLYGFELVTRIESDNPEHERSRVESVLIGGTLYGLDDAASARYFPKDALDFIYDRRFKTIMSQDYFKRSCGFFTVPKGMAIEFNFETNGFSLKEGDTAMYEVDRFYTTQGGWRDGYEFSGRPAIYDGSNGHVFRFIPILRSTMKDNKESRDDGFVVYIPLNWMTHIVKMPYGFGERNFSVTRISNHEYPPVIDHQRENKLYDYVERKANEEADAMDAILMGLSGRR